MPPYIHLDLPPIIDGHWDDVKPLTYEGLPIEIKIDLSEIDLEGCVRIVPERKKP